MASFWYRFTGPTSQGTIVLEAESNIKGMMRAMGMLEAGESIVSSGEVKQGDIFGLWLDGGAARITIGN